MLWLPALAVTLQVVLGVAGSHFLATITCCALIGIWFARLALVQRSTAKIGATGLTFGWSLNALVIGLNGGMPISRSAMSRAGISFNPTHGHLYRHVADTSATRLRPLTDVIAVRAIRNVFSVGDVILACGTVVLVAGLMRPSLADAAV